MLIQSHTDIQGKYAKVMVELEAGMLKVNFKFLKLKFLERLIFEHLTLQKVNFNIAKSFKTFEKIILTQVNQVI